MRFANAGHPKPFHLKRSAGSAVQLVNTSRKSQPALGFVNNTTYLCSETTLDPGDLIMLYTDGLYEVQGPDNTLYTQALALEAVQRRLKLPTAALFEELLEEIRTFSGGPGFSDDVCIVGMELAAGLESKPKD
jgi:sigma-B regulation protein RsbU (phosphoserine phosphatase)